MSGYKTKFCSLLALLVAISIGGSAATANPPDHAASNSNRIFGIGQPEKATDLPAGYFRDRLLSLPPKSRARAMATLRAAPWPALDFKFMDLDENGAIFYIDPPPAEAEASQEESVEPSGISAAQVFTLHSKPGASQTLFLDFDGHTLQGTTWNSYASQSTIVIGPWNVDGDASSFSQNEVDRIAEAWKRVSEDFAAWDVDVTTEDPGFLPVSRDPSNPRDYGPNVSHALITTGSNPVSDICTCGGIAYVNLWGTEHYQTTFTFNSSLSSNAMTISHETGHSLGLRHDGTTSQSYYGGHGSGATSWGPIMGAPFGKSVVTWSLSDYPNGRVDPKQSVDDDYSYIDNYLTPRGDDHEDVLLANATPIVVTGSSDVLSTTRVGDPTASNLDNKGIIGTQADIDLFSMELVEGVIDLTIFADTRETFTGSQGANLDIQVRLLDQAGGQLVLDNPLDALHAAVNYTVTMPGTYYLEITGVERPSSGDHPGYSDYGIIGQYTIAGTVPAGEVVIEPVAAPSLTANLVGSRDIQLDWSDPNAGAASELGHRLYRSVDGGNFTLLANLPANSVSYDDLNLPNGDYAYRVEAYNNYPSSETSAPSGTITVDAANVAVATSDQSQTGQVVSGSYLNTQQPAGSMTLVEEHSGGRPSGRSSYLDHRFFVTGVVPGSVVELSVTASVPSNEGREDFEFLYSLNNGSSWNWLGEIPQATGATLTATLPQDTSGTVIVRVRDTDQISRSRTDGQTDDVIVSEIKVESGGSAGDSPPSASITTPAEGSLFGDETIIMQGDASDAEDGLGSLLVNWTSSLDGTINTGSVDFNWSPNNDGQHTVTLSVTDTAAQSATDSISITVDTTAPTITAPGDINTEATGPTTTLSLGIPVVNDAIDPSPSIGNDAPGAFPLGTTVVTWTVTDAADNSSTDSQNVTIQDTTPPSITAPADVSVTLGDAVELGTPVVSDLVDPAPGVTNNALESFPLGTTVVTWTATDAEGNVATDTQSVTIIENDTTPPSITAPADLTVEATGQGTSVALGSAVASDSVDPNPAVTNDAPSLFPLGAKTVIWTATDASGNSASDNQLVTIQDTTAPSITAPADLTVTDGDSIVLGTPTVSDLVDPNPDVINDSSGSFPIGTTIVTWTATDASGNSENATQSVTVEEAGGEPLNVTEISPGTMQRGSTVVHTISGGGFEPGTSVTFINGSGPTPVATSVQVVSSSQLSVSVNVRNGGPRRERVWDVVVSSGGSSVTLSGGLTVTP